jgi:hypothetical protein
MNQFIIIVVIGGIVYKSSPMGEFELSSALNAFRMACPNADPQVIPA